MKITRIINGDNDLYALVQILPSVPKGHKVVISPPTRDEAHNAALHALLTQVSKQIKWDGALRSVEIWKRLMTAAWMRAHGSNVEMYRAIDGQGIDIVYTPTSTLSNAEQNDLMAFVEAWGSENGVTWKERPQR